MEKEYTFTRFEKAAAAYPDNTAIVFLGDTFSFAESERQDRSVCHRLTGLGVKKGDRILLYLTNCVQLVIGFLAAQEDRCGSSAGIADLYVS